MIENVGFLDQTKNIVTDEDLEYTFPTINVENDLPFKSISNGCVSYNKYETKLCGFETMKQGSISSGDVILKLPTKPVKGTADFLALTKLNNKFGSISMWISGNGEIKSTMPYEFEGGEILFLNCSFPSNIIGGEVTLSKLLQLLSLKFRKVVAVC